jgi:hypothetical protein
MDANLAAWMINGGRDPMEGSDRDRFHRQAIYEARAAARAEAIEPTGLVGRVTASIRAILRPDAPARIDPACCPA